MNWETSISSRAAVATNAPTPATRAARGSTSFWYQRYPAGHDYGPRALRGAEAEGHEMGMSTLREDGLRNIYDGNTTIEEVLKYT